MSQVINEDEVSTFMDDVLTDARRALAEGQRATAENLLKQVVRQTPANGEAWYLLGEALTEPAQKAECARRSQALGYTPESANPVGFTGQTRLLNEAQSPSAQTAVGDATPPPDAPRYASDVAAGSFPNEQTPTSDTMSSTTVERQNSPGATASQYVPQPFGTAGTSDNGTPALPPSPGPGYAYVMPTTPGASGGQLQYAGFWRRFGAVFVDGIILSIATTVLNGVASPFFRGLTTGGAQPSAGVLSFLATTGVLISFGVQWLYFAFMESSPRGATLGKMLFGLRVTNLQGQRIGFGRASARYFASLLSSLILAIGYIMGAFTARKQTLHDLIAGTVVVRIA